MIAHSTPPIDQAALRSRLKVMIVSNLNLEGMTPESITDNGPLFGEGLGLDSVDALELVVALEKEFGIRIQSHEVGKSVFASVADLADFVARTCATANRGVQVNEQPSQGD